MSKKQKHQGSNQENAAYEGKTKGDISSMANDIKHKLMNAISEEMVSKIESTFKTKLTKGKNEKGEEIDASIQDAVWELGKRLGFLASTKGQGAWAGTYPTAEGAEWVGMDKEYETYLEMKEAYADAPLAAPKPVTPEDRAKKSLKKAMQEVDVHQLELMLKELKSQQQHA